MSQPLDPSPRAQAILRAIESEAQARRQRTEGQPVPGSYAPPTAPLPPARADLATPPLGEAADRLMHLVDHVVAQTEGVRARVREVEQSLDLLSSKLSEPATIKPATDTEAAPVAAPAVPAIPATEPPPAAPPEGPDGARLMAIEMAVSGGSRGEVGTRLTQDFGVNDPAPILDDVFGAGSADSSRMPWTS